MRVLYFHQHFSTPHDTYETRAYQLARMLIDRGHKVTMVCGAGNGKTGTNGESPKKYDRSQVDGIDLIELKIPSDRAGLIRRGMGFLQYALKSTKLAFNEPYDLLFASSAPLIAGIPGIVMKRFKDKPFVFEVRDLWPELPRETGAITNPVLLKAMSGLEWASYHSADRCIGLSPGMMQGISRRGVKEEQIATIPTGCDLDLFKPRNIPRTRYPGVSDDDRVAVFAGAHNEVSGLDAVLDAAGELLEMNRPDIKFVFIGEGGQKADLLTRKKREGLQNCLFMDHVSQQELAYWLNAADIGLMTLANVPAFYYGTSPDKFFDYIASGLPVFNNYPGWLADLIRKYDCGEVVQPDDPEVFARRLSRILDQPRQLKQKGKKARKLAAEHFNRKVLAQKFVNFLEEVAHA